MKNLLKKTAAILISSSILLSLTSCEALGNLTNKFNEDEVDDVVMEYLDFIRTAKFSKAAKLTKSGDDLFSELEDEFLSDDFFEAFAKTTEYELTETTGTFKDSAKCMVNLEVVDLKDALESAGDTDDEEDIIKAFKKADTVTEEIAFKLVYDEDEETWLIKNDDDVIEFYENQLEDFMDYMLDGEGSKIKDNDGKDNDGKDDGDSGDVDEIPEFSEEAALADLQARIDFMQNMTIDDMYENAKATNPDITYEEYVGNNEPVYDFVLDSMSLTEISYEVYEVKENEVIVEITSKIPDTDGLATYFLESETMKATFCDMMFNPNHDSDATMLGIITAMNDYLHSGLPKRNFYSTASIQYDPATGLYDVYGLDEITSAIVPNLDFSNTLLADKDFLTGVAEYALENGIIDEATYQQLLAEAEIYGNSIQVEEGSDYLDFKMYEDENFKYVTKLYRTGDSGIYLIFKTQNNYSTGDKFHLTLSLDGQVIIDTDVPCHYKRCNEGKVAIAGPLVKGEYILTIIGYNGEEFATIHFNVLE